MMKVYAHRGASLERPENTLAAFRRALELGVHGIELDVRLSKDGVPMVLHDPTVDRTTDGTGRIADLTREELQRFDAGEGERIPTLRDVLELVGGKAHINLEIKDERAAPAMLELLSELPDVRWAVSGEALDYVKSQRPEADCWPGGLGRVLGLDWWRSLPGGFAASPDVDVIAERIRTHPEEVDAAFARARRLGASAVVIYYKALEPEMIARFHAEGIETWGCTLDDPDMARIYRDRGMDAICTNDPAAMLAL